jgi:hypothetical protein
VEKQPFSAIISFMQNRVLLSSTCFLLLVLSSGCTKYTNWEFQRSIFVPDCRINCVTPNGESITIRAWGEDEKGDLICQAQPHGFSGMKGEAACKKTRDSHCEYALARIAKEKPDHNCELDDSNWSFDCLHVNVKEYEQRDFVVGSSTNFPECDVIIEND